ncbi:hypothetical protein Poli38472_007906 [Pythium oligandrum]|uniref:JmjC domain-containing protein n=1 Tax=Pythium oligandrum TaxID=41045 RepID=A0A8K1FPC3_PYTOL|nr:hypothetical protein Poli38472_007906 [Pythium oligandrum]|eukprot:TMW68234.1 hypothetical protein Poli38472_007906 [Pythium oligandrum]
MALQLVAPAAAMAAPAAWPLPDAVQTTEETTIARGVAHWTERLRRFPCAKATGVAEVVPLGQHVDKTHLDATGFQRPIVLACPLQVDLLVPTSGMSLVELERAIGSDRAVRAIDVATQRELEKEWRLKDWMSYFARPDYERARILNLISLECSGTKLEQLVRPPRLLREIGWVEKHWPNAAKKDRMLAPKVQLYCLMSAAGSYTEFHIDFGGSSVWYHLYQGRKIFFLLPPTDANLQRFAEFEARYRRDPTLFFADTLPDECSIIDMHAGDTILLPSGWIHAVYTPEDSISFGGNFLSGYHMPMHMRCHTTECAQHIEGRFQFPMFEQVVWFAVTAYARMLTNCSYLLSKWEWTGLQVIVPLLEDHYQRISSPGSLEADLVERIIAICKTATRLQPQEMLAKMKSNIQAKMERDDLEAAESLRVIGDHMVDIAPQDSLSPSLSGNSSSSSSSSTGSSSDSSDLSSSDSSDNEQDKDTDGDPPLTEDDDNMDTNDDGASSSSDSSSDSSSSSSDNEDETGAEDNENEDEIEPELTPLYLF